MPRYFAYLKSCIWLWVPPLMVSFYFWPNLGAAYQPEVFWHDVPQVLGLIENNSRIAVIGLSALLLLDWRTPKQKLGVTVYLVGLCLYALCQWVIVVSPHGAWATSVFGFMAPAYLPAIWIVGIAMIGQHAIDDRVAWIRWVFISSAAIFIFAHNAHAWLVFSRLG